MAFPASLGQWLTSFGQTLPALFGQQGSGWLGLFSAGLKLVMSRFGRRSKPGAEPEA